jgi:hypothetical protein
MLRVTADVFSGRPDPTWIISDESEARAILRDVMKERHLTAESAPADAGLGFRGLLIEPVTDEIAHDFDLQGSLYLPAGPGAADHRANALAERLVASMSKAQPDNAAIQGGAAKAEAAAQVPLDAALQTFLTQQLERTSRTSQADARGAAGAEAAEATAEAEAAVTCTIELGAFNPGFWNNDASVRSSNNCYNYASNKRTNTFAQPGRGCGNMYKAITCQEVTRAALCDRLHRRFDCFPDGEKPRYLVALVVAPGPGFVDYHWYRKQKEGFWGHKPGSTAARNTDNSNRVITNPETCNRGPYTQFCGYFYTCRSQLIR